MREKPIEVFPPGEFIREEIEARGWSQEVLAEVLGRSPRLVSEIISGKRGISPETARALGDAFETGAQVWMNLESEYRLHKVPDQDDSVARRSRLYGKVPLREIIRRHWIEPSDNIDVLERRVCDFFDLKSLDDPIVALPHAARKSAAYSTDSPPLCAWLFRARRMAQGVAAAPWTETRMQSGMEQLRALRQNREDVRRIPAILAQAGVRLVVVEHLAKTRVDGAAFLLDRHSPVVALSLRYDRIDGFWHTLMHELMHIRNGDITVKSLQIDTDLVGESSKTISDRPECDEIADKDAAGFLVPEHELNDFIARLRPLYSKQKILRFAKRVEVHPGIVVGQLQHRGEIPYSHNRDTLQKVREIVTSATLTDGWGHFAPSLT